MTAGLAMYDTMQVLHTACDVHTVLVMHAMLHEHMAVAAGQHWCRSTHMHMPPPPFSYTHTCAAARTYTFTHTHTCAHAAAVHPLPREHTVHRPSSLNGLPPAGSRFVECEGGAAL